MPASPATTPNYRDLSAGEFDARVDELWDRYADCDLCPHECGVDRTAGESGACGVDDTARVASWFPHRGEEDVLRGTGGSGTIFIAACNMHCVFCQNHETSQGTGGDPTTPEEIADAALELQDRGCHNINFVTPTHVAPHLVAAVRDARERGLSVPVVWNCGGYESPEVVELLDGVVDVYMPDVKWSDDAAAAEYSKAPDYWEVTRESLRKMHRQVGDLTTDADGLATGGILVRHLVMPGHVENAKGVLAFLAAEISYDTYVNLLGQYRPDYEVPDSDRYGDIDRRVSPEEYREVVEHAREVGLERVEYDERLFRSARSV
ncbi:MAG: radical SAM protein [Haloarculaceae archaeon]